MKIEGVMAHETTFIDLPKSKEKMTWTINGRKYESTNFVDFYEVEQ